MRVFTLLSVTLSVLQFVLGKGTKKDSNVIAVFSEDDISDKLPKPESIAAEVPKNMILQKGKKLRVADTSAQSDVNVTAKRKSDKKIDATERKDKNRKKNKKNKQNSDEFDNFEDRKSKSMTNREDNDDEKIDTFVVVESTPFVFQPSTQMSIPTATPVSITRTEDTRDFIQIAKMEATSSPQRDESQTIPPQKRRQFTPRNRMNVKRANSSSNRVNLCDSRIIISILFTALFIMNI